MTKSYRSYRNAESKWLADVPSHWRLQRLKYVARPQASNVDKHTNDDETPVRLCNYTDVYNNDRITSDLNFMEATATFSEIEKFSLSQDEVIITKDSESWDDIAVPAYVHEAIEGVLCGYHLTQIRPLSDRLNGRYLFYQLCSVAINRQFQVKANGVTRFGLPAYHIDNAETLLPPLDEQHAIASFLDAKTTQIDALIAKKEALLARLAEQRVARITAAVTGYGIDIEKKSIANSPWLAQIPADWDAVSLRRCLVRMEQGWSPSCDEREADDDEWGILKSGCVNTGVFNERDHKTLPVDMAPRPWLEVQAGDVLMCRASGSRHLIGSTAVVENTRPMLMFSDKTYRLHLKLDVLDRSFLAYSMLSKYVRDQIELSISGAEGLANNIPQASVKEYVIGFCCKR